MQGGSTIVKVCSKCCQTKPLEAFNFRSQAKGTRHSYCRDCGSAMTRHHYRQNKQVYLEKNARAFAKRRAFVRQAKQRPCTDCGVQYPYYVMDFDHQDGDEKLFALNSVDRVTLKAIKREIEKCDVVCANCHRERTFQRLQKKGTEPGETLR